MEENTEDNWIPRAEIFLDKGYDLLEAGKFREAVKNLTAFLKLTVPNGIESDNFKYFCTISIDLAWALSEDGHRNRAETVLMGLLNKIQKNDEVGSSASLRARRMLACLALRSEEPFKAYRLLRASLELGTDFKNPEVRMELVPTFRMAKMVMELLEDEDVMKEGKAKIAAVEKKMRATRWEEDHGTPANN